MKANNQKALGPGDDLQMMSSPRSWPAWPLLPIKRYTKDAWIDCGLLVDVLDHKTTVFLTTLFALQGGMVRDILINKEEIKRIEYDSLDDLLKDGWVVD